MRTPQNCITDLQSIASDFAAHLTENNSANWTAQGNGALAAIGNSVTQITTHLAVLVDKQAKADAAQASANAVAAVVQAAGTKAAAKVITPGKPLPSPAALASPPTAEATPASTQATGS